MLKVAAYSKLAVEAGIIPADRMRDVLAQYQASGAQQPFETWAQQADILPAEAVARLRAAFDAAGFRCAQCEAHLSGRDLLGDIDVVCPKCGNSTFRRIRQGTPPPPTPSGTGSAPPPPPPPPPAPHMAPTVASGRDTATAFEINVGTPSSSAGSHDLPTAAAGPDTLQATGTTPTPADFERGLQPGQRIGNWEIIRMAGRGGMGAVYQARNPDLDQYAAIKILNANFLESSQQVARFREEARACAKLEHPNIIQVKDFGTLHGRAYLVLQWVEGGSLGDRLKKFGPLPVADFLDVAIQVCRGLAEAHAHGIVHRDIKPDNIMLSAKDGRVKVADFGLAKSLEAKEGLTATGAFLGTPAYMAPEQINNENIGAATDIYALGGTFFTMLSGKVPFKAGSVATVLHMHIAQPFPDVREKAPDVPEALAVLLQKMCAKKQEDRYGSMNAVADALEEVYAAVTAGGDRLAQLNRRMGGLASSGPSMVSSRAGGLVGDTMDSAERVGSGRGGAREREAAGKAGRTAAAPDRRAGKLADTPTTKASPVARFAVIAGGMLVVGLLAVAAYLVVDGFEGPDGPEGPGGGPVGGPQNPDTPTDEGVEALAARAESLRPTTASPSRLRELLADIEARLSADDGLSDDGRAHLTRLRDGVGEAVAVVERAERLAADAASADDESTAREVEGQLSEFLVRHPELRPRLIAAIDHLGDVLGEPVVEAPRDSADAWMHAVAEYVARFDAAVDGTSFAGVDRAAQAAARLQDELAQWLDENPQPSGIMEGAQADLSACVARAAEISEERRAFDAAIQDAADALNDADGQIERGDAGIDAAAVLRLQAEAPARLAALQNWRESSIGRYREVSDAVARMRSRWDAVTAFDALSALPRHVRLWIERANAVEVPVAAAKLRSELAAQVEAHPEWGPFFGAALRRLSEVSARELPPIVGELDPNLPERTARFQNAGPLVLRRVLPAETWPGTGPVHGVAIVGAGAQLAASNGAVGLRVVTLADGQEVRTLGTGESAASTLAANAAGTALVAGCADGVARMFNALRWGPAQTFDGLQGQGAITTTLVAEQGGTIVIVGNENGRARVYSDLSRTDGLMSTTDSTRALRAAAATPNGQTFALAGDDRIVRFYEMPGGISDGRHLANGEAHFGPVRTLAASPENRYFVSGSDDGTVVVWRADNQREVRRLVGHGAAVTASAFTASGAYLITGSADGTVRLWDVHDDWKPVLDIDLHTDAGYAVTSIAMAGDGQRCVIGTDKGDVLVFDLIADWRPRR